MDNIGYGDSKGDIDSSRGTGRAAGGGTRMPLRGEGWKDVYYASESGKGGSGMKTTVDDILKKAMAMPSRDRAVMAERLIESLDSSHDRTVEAAWQSEIERRIKEIDSDEIRLVPWEEVRARLGAA